MVEQASNWMSKKMPFILPLCVLAIFAFPGNTHAQDAANPIDCRSAQSSSVGRTAAMGGSFVPVSDASVTLNSGILVYKECVLRQMISKQKEAQTAALLRETLEDFGTGREVCNWVDDQYICENRPYYSENIGLEQQELANNTVARVLTGNLLDEISPLFRDDVKRTIQRTYSQQTLRPSASFACSYAGTAQQLSAIHNGAYNGPQDLFAVADPNCNPMFSFYNAQSAVMSNVAAEQQNMLTQLGWNNGVYSMTRTDDDGVNRVIAPGFILADRVQQQLGSGFRQLESANDLGQIVDQLFSGIGNAVIDRSIGGLRGLFSASIGTSYIDQVVARTSAGVQSVQLAAQADAVAVAVANETAYRNAKQRTADFLQLKIRELQGLEAQCWNSIEPLVTTYARDHSLSLRLPLATTTEQFAQRAASNAGITALLETVNSQIEASDRIILTPINQIRARLTSTNGAEIYNEINTVIAGATIHSADNALEATRETETVQTALAELIPTTARHWADDPLSATDRSSGWCKYTDTNVIGTWASRFH